MAVTKSGDKCRSPGAIVEDKDSSVQLAFEEPEVHILCLWVSSLLEREWWHPRASNPKEDKDGRKCCAFP